MNVAPPQIFEELRVLVTEFRQETNSFNPVKSTLASWAESGWILGPAAMLDFHQGARSAVDGMLAELQHSAPNSEIHFGPGYYSQSGGTAHQEVMDAYVEELIDALSARDNWDVLLFSFHGALQTTAFDDAEAEVLRRVRQAVGKEVVIGVSTDMHGLISRDFAQQADVICGYWTYPHVDFFETGARAAKLALMRVRASADPQAVAWVPVPMIVSASSYNTLEGPFADLILGAKKLVEMGEILDFSIFQMQPWLDVADPHSTAVVVAKRPDTAIHYAKLLAERLYAWRHTFTTELATIEEVIELAEKLETAKPVILVDSADSTNAGAPGDSMAVARHILELESNLKSATVVSDVEAVKRAHALGVGASGQFKIGGSIDSRVPHIVGTGYVRSLHDGSFRPEISGHTGNIVNIGMSAVIRFGNLDVLACERIQGNGDPQLYRAFGIEPLMYDLICVKANTSFRNGYKSIGGTIVPADTPGSASANVVGLPFVRMPRSIFPWKDDFFSAEPELAGRGFRNIQKDKAPRSH